MATPATAKRSTRTRATKSCAESPASAASKRSTIAPLSPVAARSRSFARSSVRRNSGSSGRKKLRGCGSKVSAAAFRPSALARASAAAITARWPRCTPSKLPMATTAPSSAWSADASPRTTTNGSLGGGWSVMSGAETGLGRRCKLDHGRACHRKPGRRVQASSELPAQPVHHRFWRDARRREDARQRGGVGIVAVAELLGVDACGHKKEIIPKGGGPLKTRAHQIADPKKARALHRPAARGFGKGERLLVDRPIGLAGIDHLAARGRIGIGDRARAVDELVAALDHHVGVGADHRQRTRAHARDEIAVIVRRLDRK